MARQVAVLSDDDSDLCPSGYYLPPGEYAPGGCVPISTNGEQMDQQQCESSGGVWVDGTCLTAAQYQCISSGGSWINGVCLAPGTTTGISTTASMINWPLVGGLGLISIGLISAIVALVAE
jgi:hypothetical protein